MSLGELTCSLLMAAHQSPPLLLREDGFTQASRVMPLVRWSAATSGMLTKELEAPLNWRAPPYFPDADHTAFEIVPLFPFPETSVRVVPLPWSNCRLQAARA